ncbi:MAG TPA: glycosyltransferase family A protein, partial [Urbifossiella sp.]
MHEFAPLLSLIVPTRGRPEQLRTMLASVAATARNPERVEIILVIDSDDLFEPPATFPTLNIKRIIGAPGRTMGQLNRDGYEASRGQYVMLLNDDVIVRTRGWDRTVLSCFR